jgi:hypothetical protein
MAKTAYSGNPAGSPRDRVRYLLGDTSSRPELTDEEIAYELAAASSSAEGAAIALVRGLIARATREVDFSAASHSQQASQRLVQLRGLLADLEMRGGAVRVISTGGTYTADDLVRGNVDLRQPAFTSGNMDAPGTSGDPGGGSGDYRRRIDPTAS